MNFSLFPAPLLLVRWTALLLLGWMVHGLVRNRHPRWRLILWRSIFCFTLLMPLAPFSILKIPVRKNAFRFASLPSAGAAMQASGPSVPAVVAEVQPTRKQAAFSATTTPAIVVPRRNIPWAKLCAAIWAAGALAAIGRLIQLHRRFSQIAAQSCAAEDAAQDQARATARRLKVTRRFSVRISNITFSPCVGGLFNPVILLPKTLMDTLTSEEWPALLAHEIAHFRGHDLFWSIGWRWLQAFCWPHPLVWAIPSVHSLACEEEADRVASNQLQDHRNYSQLLARLALRILALPKMETHAALSAGSHISRRIHQLNCRRSCVWTLRDSVSAIATAAFLFLLTAGSDFVSAAPSHIKQRQVLVTVQDQDGKPLAGASIHPEGFRVKGRHHADAYSWNDKLFGPAKTTVTDENGHAYVTYPVEGIPSEKEFTASLFFSVSCPGYSPARPQDYSVEGTNDPIRLDRGVLLQVSGYFGAQHEPVTDLVPNVSEEEIKSSDWEKMDNGIFATDNISPGKHMLDLMGRLSSGQIVYSGSVVFTGKSGQSCRLDLEMKPGIRLEGRVDDRVPRPIKNGRVLICVRPKEYPAWLVPEDYQTLIDKYGYYKFWHSYRQIQKDGTFVFESIPPGEADVIAIGDGFVSRSTGHVQNRINGKLVDGPVIGIPQPFPLNAPVTQITVETEPTATLDLTAATQRGKPIEGVAIFLNPNVLRIGGIFGIMKNSSEEPYRRLAPLPALPFTSAKTDRNGKVVIRDIPAITRGMDIDSADYQAPLQDPRGWRDRHIRMRFSASATNEMKLVMERKGKDFIDGSE